MIPSALPRTEVCIVIVWRLRSCIRWRRQWCWRHQATRKPPWCGGIGSNRGPWATDSRTCRFRPGKRSPLMVDLPQIIYLTIKRLACYLSTLNLEVMAMDCSKSWGRYVLGWSPVVEALLRTRWIVWGQPSRLLQICQTKRESIWDEHLMEIHGLRRTDSRITNADSFDVVWKLFVEWFEDGCGRKTFFGVTARSVTFAKGQFVSSVTLKKLRF